MAFLFNLQRVLDMRDERVKQCEQEVERLRNIIVSLRTMLVNEREHYFRERDELNAQVRASEIARIPIYERSLETRKTRMIQILETVREVENELDFATQTLIQAKRDLKVLENLRERRLDEYNQKLERAERKFLDEHATMKHVRQEILAKKARN